MIKLNDRDPQVWMQVVPQSLSYGGYSIVGNRMHIRLGLDALTQAPAADGLAKMFVPVVADYAELVPVITQALGKRATRPFNLPELGAVDASFANIEVYGASNGRIAVGSDILAKHRYGVLPAISGRIWFAGKPHNAPGSQVIHFSDLSVSGAAAARATICWSRWPTTPDFPMRLPTL